MRPTDPYPDADWVGNDFSGPWGRPTRRGVSFPRSLVSGDVSPATLAYNS